MKAFRNIAPKWIFGAALVIGASLATAAPAAAQSFGFSVGGPGYSFSYNNGYPYYGGYGYYARPPAYGYYYGPAYYYSAPRAYFGRPYYARPYYGRPYRGYRR
jgi:hypothetical protein